MTEQPTRDTRKTWRVKVRNATGGEVVFIYCTANSAASALQGATDTAQRRWRKFHIPSKGATAHIVDEMGRIRGDVHRQIEIDAVGVEEGTGS